MVVGYTDQAREDIPRMMAATRAGMERSYRRNLGFFGLFGVLMLVMAALSTGVARVACAVLGVVLLVLAVLRVRSQHRFRRVELAPLGDVALVVDDHQVRIFTQLYMTAADPVETLPLEAVSARVVPAGPSDAAAVRLPERLVVTGPGQRTWQFYTTWLDVPAQRVAARINRR